MQDFEKLGAFYLGKLHELDSGQTREDLLLYDSKDLTTHAVCVGMTGSGKTGLCLSLLEEAAIDGIPAIAIDPKGDLGNLFLTFPELRPEDFRPWVDESAATRQGLTADQLAAQTAKTWRDGLAEWGQSPERIARFRDAVDMAIYTPGSNAGMPMSVLRSFDAPPVAVLDDPDALGERVGSAASGLLALVGIDADPLVSREHVLLSNLLTHAWREGRNMDIAALIGAIQSPPFDKMGVFDLETFYPAKARAELAMRLNNLLASPSFAGWIEGEPIDVKKLLYTAEGRPRLSVISIAHLSDAERMFFVTILLNEILAWARSQPGTSSLRAVLYMDEVFGFFPPTANPPSKTPMLTLLKQARAYGLGVVLATQNPVDLDYKGLSNAGTWFLGRLQTERDKARVLEGLEGASAQAGATFDRQAMERTLAGLGSRVFLLNNVHEDEPVVFETRWALSYLRGPLTRTQIQTLMEPRKRQVAQREASTATAAVARMEEPVALEQTPRSEVPLVPPEVEQFFLPCRGDVPPGSRLVYRPALLGRGRLHFVKATYKVDTWQRRALIRTVHAEVPDAVWEGAPAVDEDRLELQADPPANARFGGLPADLLRAKNYATWTKDLKDHFYLSERLPLWKCAPLKQYSQPDETEGDFRVRLTGLAHEQRDLAVEKLRDRYASKLATLKDRIRAAEARVETEESQYRKAKLDTAVSIGSSILGALFGRKLASRVNVGRAATSARSASRAAQQRGDIGRAEEKLDDLKEKLTDLEAKFASDVDQLEDAYRPDSLELDELSVSPRKSDIQVENVALVWLPWRIDAAGVAELMCELT